MTESVSVDGVEVRVQAAGNGPPLVYLHGADGAGWPTGLDSLADHFRVYLPEHPGFGLSERPVWLETTQDMALFYQDLFEVLDLTNVNLVGHGLGGWIAAELASLCCHQLRRLVLVDAAGLRIPGEQRLDMFRLSPDAVVQATFEDPAFAESALTMVATPEATRVQVRNRAMTARLGWNPYLCSPTLAPRLRRIRVPTLIVWGAQDRLIPVSHGSLFAQGIPGAELTVIDGCGHAPAVEKADEFARVVGNFLADKEA